MESKGFTPKLL